MEQRIRSDIRACEQAAKILGPCQARKNLIAKADRLKTKLEWARRKGLYNGA